MTDVIIEQHGAILEIAMNRPAYKNALTHAMYDEMTAALESASTNPATRVVILRGEGGNFTSGNDLKDFQKSPPTDENSPVFRFLSALIRCPKPVLAAVDGVAVGIGTTMLLHCDMAWAADNALFLMPFVNLAVVPEAGSSYLLPRMVGHQRAAELLMLGERFDTATAREIGIVNGGLPAGDVLSRVRDRAATLAAKPPEAVRLTKRLLRQRYGDTLDATLIEEARLFVERLHSPEFHEAIQAFFEKRAPDFSRFE